MSAPATGKSTATSGTYCWGQCIPLGGYDRFGNLVTINSSQCSSPALSLSVNGYNQISTSGYTYEANGDMLTDGSDTYTWNGEGQLKWAGSVNSSYDGDGKRVEKSSGTHYWLSRKGYLEHVKKIGFTDFSTTYFQ